MMDSRLFSMFDRVVPIVTLGFAAAAAVCLAAGWYPPIGPWSP